MKLVELECQNCGAALKIEEGADIVTCPYCNASYKLDDEVKHVKYDDMENSGYEFEKGRIKAQKEHYANNTVGSNTIGSQTKFPVFIIPIFIIMIIALFIFMFTRMQSARKGLGEFSDNVNNSVAQKAKEEEEAQEKQRELESERYSFNFKYSNGRKATIFVESMLNEVIDSNRTNKDRFITVNFKDISTQETEQILEIEKQLEKRGEYDVILDYDDDGFVNAITIK